MASWCTRHTAARPVRTPCATTRRGREGEGEREGEKEREGEREREREGEGEEEGERDRETKWQMGK